MKNDHSDHIRDSMGYAFGGVIKPPSKDREPLLFETFNSLLRPDWGIAMEARIEKKKKEEKDKQGQLDRIEAKLDKLLSPQLINGVWR